jgi:D-alanyl-D-alanine carboxypeptidase (penicillin-binding protein 5/6)
VRFSEATTLLNYGFANYALYTDDSPPVLSPLPVTKGLSSSVSLTYADTFQALVEGTGSQNQITATLKLPESVSAPVYEGDTIGYLVYESQGKELGRVAVLAKEAVEQAHLKDYFYQILQKYF